MTIVYVFKKALRLWDDHETGIPIKIRRDGTFTQKCIHYPFIPGEKMYIYIVNAMNKMFCKTTQ